MYDDYENEMNVSFSNQTLKRLKQQMIEEKQNWLSDDDLIRHCLIRPMVLYRKFVESHNFPRPVKIDDCKYWIIEEINNWFSNHAPRWKHEELIKD